MIYIETPEEYVGRLLYLQPSYGYGWGWSGDNDTSSPLDYGAGAFGVRVRYFLGYRLGERGEARNVVVGVVEQDGHPFHGYWVACSNRLHWRHDFVGRLCLRWDLRLGPSRPHGQMPDRPTGARIYQGYGILAESVAYIEARLGAARVVAV